MAKLHDHAEVVWPEAVIGDDNEIREQYIAAVKRADEGDYVPLIDFHRRFAANRSP